MGTPTRYLSGVSTQPRGTILGDYPFPDPFHTASSAGKDVAAYVNDFLDQGSTVSRTITGAGTTFALVDGLGGVGVLTPGGAAVASSIYRTAAAFQFIEGNKFWWVHRFKFSAVGAGITGYLGVIKTGAATTDSLLFVIAATGVVSLVSTVNNVATTLIANVMTLASDTWADLGFYYNGTDLLVFKDDAVIGRIAAPTIGAASTTLTNAMLTIITQITPAAAETVSLDYALVAQEITR